MSSSTFQPGAAIDKRHAGVYVLRKADEQVLSKIKEMKDILLCAPRQQGKSSLIAQLMRTLNQDGAIRAVVIDLSVVTDQDESGPCSSTSWCRHMLDEMSPKLSGVMRLPALPSNAYSPLGILNFLRTVKKELDHSSKKLVIALDEVGHTSFSCCPQFFINLRALINEQANDNSEKSIAFVFAGAFHPSDLIPDATTSPFNVADRVELEDFSKEDVKELLRQGPWEAGRCHLLAERIFQWTDGHPYLTHACCADLDMNHSADEQQVDLYFDRLLHGNCDHIDHLRRGLEKEPDLRKRLEQIHNKHHFKFTPSLEPWQSKLQLMGWIKKGPNNECVIRNRLFKLILTPRNQVFVSYSHRDAIWLNRLKTMLAPVIAEEKLDVWDDRRIAPGRDWHAEIKEAIDRAKVAVLLISPEYLQSPFILQHELEPLLLEAKNNRIRLFWILIRECLYEHCGVYPFQAAHDITKPLADPHADKDKVLKEIVQRIKAACDAQP